MPKALYPDYMFKFRCIGDQCEDTCCKQWTIQVDRETYLKYNRLEDRELSQHLLQNMELKEASKRTPDQYAVLKLDEETGMCKFLQNGLCSIHKNFGESYLPNVCAMYPRRSNWVDDAFELSMFLSCPEAVRQVLLNPEGISFTYIEAEEPVMVNARLTTKVPDSFPLAKYFWDIRTFAIEIMQNRAYSLPHRFMQLAVLADTLDETLSAGKGRQVLHVVQRFKDQLASGGEVTRIGTFPTNTYFQFKFLNGLLLALVHAKPWNNDKYKDCLDQYIEGIQKAGDNLSEAEWVRYYEECRRKYYDPFMAEHHYMFENYIVNHLYSMAFPYDTEPHIFSKVFYIGIMYALLRMQLIGMAAWHGKLTTDIAVQLIYSFTRNFEHNHNFRNFLLKKCESENIKTLGHLSLLVMEGDTTEVSQ